MSERRLGEGGRYEVRVELGAGAIGVVSLAFDHRLSRFVAVKELSVALARNPKIRARFRNEALIQGDIVHENVVRALDVIETDDVLAIIIDFVDGSDLEATLERAGGRLDWATVRRLMPPIFSGVAAAHRKGIVHRDLKPANILIDRSSGIETPRITDFGIAKIVGSAEGLTREGAVLGTPAYMSPEQLKGALDLDARTDIYALGAIIYRLLCGGPPHQGASEYDTTHKVLSREAFTPPSLAAKGVPAALNAFVAQAMAFDRAERFSSVDAMAVAFSQLEVSVGPVDAPWPTRSSPKPGRWLAVTASVALTAAVGAALWFSRRAPPESPTPSATAVPPIPPAVPALDPGVRPPTWAASGTATPPVAQELVAASPPPAASPSQPPASSASTAAPSGPAVAAALPPPSRSLPPVAPVAPPALTAAHAPAGTSPPSAAVAEKPSPPGEAGPGWLSGPWRFTTLVMGSHTGNGIGVNGFYELMVPPDGSTALVRKTGFSNGRRRVSVEQSGQATAARLCILGGQPVYSVELQLNRGPSMWFVWTATGERDLRGFWRQTGSEWLKAGFWGILQGRWQADAERELTQHDPRTCLQTCALAAGIRADLASVGRSCCLACAR